MNVLATAFGGVGAFSARMGGRGWSRGLTATGQADPRWNGQGGDQVVPPGGYGGQVPGGGYHGGGIPYHGRGFGRGIQGGFEHPGLFGFLGPLAGLIMLAVWVGIIALIVVAFWQIFGKAGFPPAYGLLMLIPLVNVGLLVYLAFSEWPALSKAQEPATAPPPSPGSAEPDADTAPMPSVEPPAESDS